jgi:flagellar FliJ protein
MSSKRLMPMRMLSELRVEQAENRYLEQRRVLSQQQARLDDLGRYHGEYRRMPQGDARPGLLVNRAAFAERVADAVRQQSVAVDRARQSAELHQGYLANARRDAEAVEKLIARRRLLEQCRAARRLQNELDEHAARRHGASS